MFAYQGQRTICTYFEILERLMNSPIWNLTTAVTMAMMAGFKFDPICLTYT
jgi:predicted RNA polymerase sigma factor